MNVTSWHRGSAIVVRTVRLGSVETVRTMRVVMDHPDLLATYIAPDYPCRRNTGVWGGPRGRNLLRPSAHFESWAWRGSMVLCLYRPATAYSVQLFRRAVDGASIGWYIDLIEPYRRTSIGIDLVDLDLDVWIQPDRSGWEWKDEDEFDWAVTNGRLPEGQVTSIRACARRAIQDVMTSPDQQLAHWETWEPDPDWGIPELPEGWQIPPAPPIPGQVAQTSGKKGHRSDHGPAA